MINYIGKGITMTLTLRELLQQNPVITVIGIVVIAIALWRIVRGKSGDKPGKAEPPASPAVAAAASQTASQIAAQIAAQNAAQTANAGGGDIVAAITAAVNEHRKKG